jgi:hypothetical protein
MSLVTANDTNENFTSRIDIIKMPSCVECFVLLHSPIIIDIKKLEAIHLKVQKIVTDDEMDDDI